MTSALQINSFRYFLTMRFLLTMGIWMQELVCAWYVYDLTHDPLSLGLIGLAEALPAVGLSLFGGYVSDIYRKKVVLLLSLSVFMTMPVLLLIFSNILPNNHFVSLVYAVTFILGLARAFYAPSAFSLMGLIVPKTLYSSSSAWNSASWQIATVISPAIGGILYAALGFNISIAVSMGLMTLSFISACYLPNIAAPLRNRTESILESLRVGVKFVFSTKILISAISLDLVCVFFGGATALLPVFAKDILHLGPEGLGFLRAAPAVGAVLTMLYMTKNPPQTRIWGKLLIAIAGFGISIIVFGLSENFYLSMLFLALSGAFDAVSVVIRSIIIQTYTPDNMRGRVSAVNTMFIGSSNEIGAFESGATAKLLGTVTSVVAGACVTLGVVGATYWRSADLLKVNIVKLEEKE